MTLSSLELITESSETLEIVRVEHDGSIRVQDW